MMTMMIIMIQPPNGIAWCPNGISLAYLYLSLSNLESNSINKFKQDLASFNFGAHLNFFVYFFRNWTTWSLLYI